ncbi:hypothetical protein ONS95_008273 [Cadophora gregata]|uniref:uncharacterized protein n=1 Tax=Cadophora gregata TaxID=51156 RepID=UPI0026DCC4FB|nr:uncharacterized protein ONS95_008273 [Cadophora gregata]KAK0100316.1 hypothetical protein ONS96_007596 [Cadophora gregata f. sp. sojae]KAK0126692.1 hypothetical protein ONS95_008273 [Cadophora gregata]
MSRLTHHLRQATRNVAIVPRRIHHVNWFNSRVFSRRIHQEYARETGRIVGSDETRSEGNKDGSVGFGVEEPSGKPTGEKVELLKQGALTPDTDGTPPISKYRDQQEFVDVETVQQSGLNTRPNLSDAVAHPRLGRSDRNESFQNSEQTEGPKIRRTLSKKQNTKIIRRLSRVVNSTREEARTKHLLVKAGVTSSDIINPLPQPTEEHLAMEGEQNEKVDLYQMAKRSCTLECEFPEKTMKEDLLAAIKALEPPAWKVAGYQSVVLLFTPSFAAMVENDATFVPDVLKALTFKRQWIYEISKIQTRLKVDVVCACVDGLSPVPEILLASVGTRQKEGFSILYGPECEPIYSPPNEIERPPSSSPSMQSSVTIRKGQKTSADITLPLANTLFKTGRLSTLLVSSWEYNHDQKDFFAVKEPVERENVVIKMFEEVEQTLPKSFIPAIALTPLRPIVSGLGNIVRTIDFGGEEGIGPASRELESTVTKYLNTMGYGNTTIDVWALVVPPESGSTSLKMGSHNPIPKPLSFTVEELQRQWLVSNNMSQYSQLGRLIPNMSAQLCRVLSGGGGWGAKQGLLSLDPQTTYSEVPEARFDFSGGSLEEQQNSALGNIAQEGALIQFFVARRDPSPHKYQPRVDCIEGRKPSMRQSAVFGAVPSTVDDIPTPAPETSEESTDKPRDPFTFRYGHFGFVSESGMFVRHSQHPTPDQPLPPDSFAKVDLPYSYFYNDYRKPKPKNEQEQKLVIRKVPYIRKDLIRRIGVST